MSFLPIHVSAQDAPKVFNYADVLSLLDKYGLNAEDEFKYCCRYLKSRSRSPGNSVPFDLKTGWFVWVQIQRRNLVRLDMIGSCKRLLGGVRDCSEDEIHAEYIKRLAAYEGFPGWYGKYHNRFVFYSGDSSLPETDLYLGQKMKLLKRTDEQDILLLGPMTQKPDRAELVFSNGQIITLF